MIIPMLCVTIFVILVVWFLLPRVARLMIHTPTAISIFVCLSMVQLMAVFIAMRCTLCGHFLHVALTLILVAGYAIAASYIACKIRGLMVTVCPSQFATLRTLIHFLFSCRRRHTRSLRDWSSDVCSSDLQLRGHSSESASPGSTPGSDSELLFPGAADATQCAGSGCCPRPGGRGRRAGGVRVGRREQLGRASCGKGRGPERAA